MVNALLTVLLVSAVSLGQGGQGAGPEPTPTPPPSTPTLRIDALHAVSLIALPTEPPVPPPPADFAKSAVRPVPRDPRYVLPKIKRSWDPAYTSAAMHAKITGHVVIDAVVEVDGTVGETRIAKSLDVENGLDDQALRAAKRWVFEPGRFEGQQVPMIVRLDMEFRLH